MLNKDLMQSCTKIFTVMRIYKVFYLSRFGTTKKCMCEGMTTSDSGGEKRFEMASRLLRGMSRPGELSGTAWEDSPRVARVCVSG